MPAPLLTSQATALEDDLNQLLKQAKQAKRQLSPKYMNIIDDYLRNPELTQTELAARHGITRQWLNAVMNSDAFQAQMATRRNQLLSARDKKELSNAITQTAFTALDVVNKELDNKPTAQLALEALGVAATVNRTHKL